MSEDKKVILDYKEHERLLHLEKVFNEKFKELQEGKDIIIITGSQLRKIDNKYEYWYPFLLIKNPEKIKDICNSVEIYNLSERLRNIKIDLENTSKTVKELLDENIQLTTKNVELQKEIDGLNYHIKALSNKTLWYKKLFN